MDLFELNKKNLIVKQAPLADRMRPRTLDEFVGQQHILGPGRLLRRAIEADQLSSLIFFGPPGTGKTSLARIIANTTKAQFISINAVLAGVKDIKDAISAAQKTLGMYGKRTILFIDEVHRFNKAQQDALLPHVENGVLILIGATTENPYFEVNKALVSRSRIFQLNLLEKSELITIAMNALTDKERGYGNLNVQIDHDALEHLVSVANGDARGVLNALELAVETTRAGPDGTIRINRSIAEESIQRRAVLYDKDGDAHYDTVSAFIKSLRGSDPDAALYWMAKMLYAGEDPRFIFRRMLILASEDIGMADPKALGVVVDAARAFDYVGLPEGRYHLAHACIYLATAPKSNSLMAFFDALDTVAKEGCDEVPRHLQDPNRDARGFGHGKGYLYPHSYREHWVAQQYLPRALQGRIFYQPSDQGFEQEVKDRVGRLREAMVEAMVENESLDPIDSDNQKNVFTSFKGQWLKRTVSTEGSTLASVRDRILEMAQLNRNSLVLDVSGRAGLLVLEACRRVSDGAVWALVHDDSSYEIIEKMAKLLDKWRRPQIVRTSWEKFEIDLEAAAGKGVRFDSVIGRNVLTSTPEKTERIARLATLLSDKGVCVLGEVVPSLGQRLSDIVNFFSKDKRISEKFRETEFELLTDQNDPMVNWNGQTLRKKLMQTNAHFVVDVFEDVTIEKRHISADEIERWFRFQQSNASRISLGTRLRHKLCEDEVNVIKETIKSQLSNTVVPWKTAWCFLLVKRK